MNDFLIWFKLGMDHLLEPGALDHFLILSILAVTYPPKDWKRTFLLVLAFTAGHALSLFFAVNFQLPLPEQAIEIAIAVSILFSALLQFPWNKKITVPLSLSLLSVLFFGLIHGLGFSLQLKSLLGDGTRVLLPLLYFNLGLETVQNIFVVAVMGFSLLLTFSINLSGAIFKFIIICLSGLIALFIAAERLLLL